MAIERQPSHVYSSSAFRRPQVAIELVLFVLDRRRLGVVLVPWATSGSGSRWGIPAATVEDQESLDAVIDEIAEPLLGSGVTETRQVATFDRLSDRRGRMIEIAYLAATGPGALDAAIAEYRIGFLGGDSSLTDPEDEAIEVSAGHIETIGTARDRLRALLETDEIVFDLLSPEFTLRELHSAHEAIIGTSLNYDSFRRSVLTASILEPTGHREQNVTHRPAELYRLRA